MTEVGEQGFLEYPYEASSHEDLTRAVMESLHGVDIEADLLELAQIGGTPIDPIDGQPFRFAVGRLALSPIDVEARQHYIVPKMFRAGMEIQPDHPFGSIGIYRGQDPELPPIMMISHTDSVPMADMYDGTTGVIGAIKVVEAMNKLGYRPKRDVVVVALTGEESSAYGFALFGSRGMFHGLTDRELDAKVSGGASIRETLGEYSSEQVKSPIIGPKGDRIPTPAAVIELHVEQSDTLDREGIDLGVVEAIASPTRFFVEIGDGPLAIDNEVPKNARTYRLRVRGKSDHSGATPMGVENRADGLVGTAYALSTLMFSPERTLTSLDIGQISIDDEAMNKIPGLVVTELRVSGEDLAEVAVRVDEIKRKIDVINSVFWTSESKFDELPVELEEVDNDSSMRFFKKDEIRGRQTAALRFIKDVNSVANFHANENVVGTVGMFDMNSDGIITLGLDVRGIDKVSRDAAVSEMKLFADWGDDQSEVDFGEPLPGSEDPVVLDKGLVTTVKTIINKYHIGSSEVMSSAAGHDAQNAAKAGINTVMIFAQSNNGGVAHNPDAYTHPENLEKGVRALAAVVLALAG